MTFPRVDLRGIGGKELEIAKLFPTLVRESGPLHDFVDPNTAQRYEIKKTGNSRLQSWIDPTKYVALTSSDRKIIFRFVRFDPNTGECVEILDTTLGEIIRKFVTPTVLRHAKAIVKMYPKRSQFQFKLNIFWRKKNMKKPCEWCHTKIKKQIRTVDGQFCSTECADLAKVERQLNTPKA